MLWQNYYRLLYEHRYQQAAIILQNLSDRLRKSDISWKLTDQEILEKRLYWAKNSIKDIKRIEERYYLELNTL
jgi:tRNA (guanosine-2'-O-)-methyltransferase